MRGRSSERAWSRTRERRGGHGLFRKRLIPGDTTPSRRRRPRYAAQRPMGRRRPSPYRRLHHRMRRARTEDPGGRTRGTSGWIQGQASPRWKRTSWRDSYRLSERNRSRVRVQRRLQVQRRVQRRLRRENGGRSPQIVRDDRHGASRRQGVPAHRLTLQPPLIYRPHRANPRLSPVRGAAPT